MLRSKKRAPSQGNGHRGNILPSSEIKPTIPTNTVQSTVFASDTHQNTGTWRHRPAPSNPNAPSLTEIQFDANLRSAHYNHNQLERASRHAYQRRVVRNEFVPPQPHYGPYYNNDIQIPKIVISQPSVIYQPVPIRPPVRIGYLLWAAEAIAREGEGGLEETENSVDRKE